MTKLLTDAVFDAHDAAAHREPRPVAEVGGRQKGASSAPATSTRRRFLFIGAMSLVAALLLTACDWTQFRYGPAHTGFNPTETKISPANVGTLVEAWSAVPGGYPAVANGVAYVGSGDGKLYAFDAAGATGCSGAPKTCTPLWTATTGGAIHSPAVANGVVYVGSGDGKLYAFDAAGATGCSGTPKTCTPLWTAITGGGGGEVRMSPAVANGVVYVGVDSRLDAFDAAGVTNCSGTPKTCMPLWTGITFGPGESPAVANGVVYVGGFNILYAFDAAGVTNCSGVPKTCTPLWTATTTGGLILTSPAVANGVVYVGPEGGASNQLYAFDAAGATNCSGTPRTCTPLWTDFMGTSSQVEEPPAVANGIVYVTGAGILHAFDAAGATGCSGTPKTCTPLWTATSTFGTSFNSPAVANGVVYVGDANNELYAFDAAGITNCSGTPKTCTPLWTATTGGWLLAVANGVVYGSGDGRLKAYQLP